MCLASDPAARRRLAEGAASRSARFTPDLAASAYRQVTLQVLAGDGATVVNQAAEELQRL